MAETRIATQVRLVLEAQCREIADQLAAQCPAGVGFALFLFDFGDGGNLAYVSNAERATMVLAVREWLARNGVDEASEDRLELARERLKLLEAERDLRRVREELAAERGGRS